MKRTFFVLISLFVVNIASAQWKPAGDRIKTAWAEKIDVQKVLPEYPRPMMERSDWQNLNGLWEYSIQKAGAAEPAKFDGSILVPFAIESSLSGVQKTVGQENELWYKRSFTVSPKWKGKRVLLQFGAVDWKSEIWLNDIKIGSHKGGFTPFCFDITPFLQTKTPDQKLVVKVWDPTDSSFQPRGKQTNAPKGIFYTSVTGIWQTVWIEAVPEKHITSVKTVPNTDKGQLNIKVAAEGATNAEYFEAKVLDGGKLIASVKSSVSEAADLYIPDAKLWSPESPVLYDLQVSLISNGLVVDQVKSYFAMRKISTKRDDNGIVRIQLNNKDYFGFGPLDQGWWPDGLYTAPTDEALRYDIQKTKDLGFNLIRKHVKVEPARWYTHCDQVGILVWQDMPSGGDSPRWQSQQYFNGIEFLRTDESEANYRREWKDIMDLVSSNPSIICWVPFNEAWGQFKTKEIAEWTKGYDPSRLVNAASGGNHYPIGDMLDLHNYPMPKMYLYDGQRPTVLGEYGGIGFPMEGHLWASDKNWGYVQFKDSKAVTDEYVKYGEMLLKMVKTGFSAAIYTQTTDVEGEVNGLMTYDRKVVKMDENRVKEINQKICNSLNK
jgi:beta-galactosidase/beta-glucuronidase